MKKLFACILALLLVLLTPASANSTPTRQGSTDSSALEVDEGCPVTVTAEQLTFHVSEVEGASSLAAQVEAVYQMENPTEEPLSVQMSFYLEERSGHMSSLWTWTAPSAPSPPTAGSSPSTSGRWTRTTRARPGTP